MLCEEHVNRLVRLAPVVFTLASMLIKSASSLRRWMRLRALARSHVLSFTDPQTVTINAVAKVLPRTSTRDSSGVFTLDTGDVKLTVSSAYGKRTRRTARIDFRKTAADPLFPAQNTPYSMSFYVVCDAPIVGFTVAEQKQVIDGFLVWLSASSGAAITKLLGGEN